MPKRAQPKSAAPQLQRDEPEKIRLIVPKCAFNPCGVTESVCATISGIGRNQPKCAAFEGGCRSKARRCSACVAQGGGEASPVSNFEKGLCEFHDKHGSTKRRPDPYAQYDRPIALSPSFFRGARTGAFESHPRGAAKDARIITRGDVVVSRLPPGSINRPLTVSSGSPPVITPVTRAVQSPPKPELAPAARENTSSQAEEGVAPPVLPVAQEEPPSDVGIDTTIDRIGLLDAKSLEILRLRAEGLSNGDIAKKLKCKYGAVSSGMSVIYKTLGISHIINIEEKQTAVAELYRRHIASGKGTIPIPPAVVPGIGETFDLAEMERRLNDCLDAAEAALRLIGGKRRRVSAK